MTIFSNYISDGFFLSYSDTLITRSSPGSYYSQDPPLRGETLNTNGFQASGFAQKTVLLDNNSLFQWAGNLEHARLFIEKLRDFNTLEYFKSNPSSFASIWRESIPDCDLSFSVNFLDGEGLKSYQERAQVRNLENNFLKITAGSGAAYLRAMPGSSDSSIIYGKNVNIHKIFFEELTKQIHSELFHPEYRDSKTCGWYEITHLIRSKFEKIPYSILIWDLKNPDPNIFRAIFSEYLNDALIVHRAFNPSNGPLAVIEPPGSMGISPSAIQNYLSKGRRCSHHMCINILVLPGNNEITYRTYESADEPLIIDISEGKYEFRMPAKLKRLVLES